MKRNLNDTAVKNAKPKDKPYKMTDGGGLYLLVKPNGSKLWRYKYRVNGKEQNLAIGCYPEITLKDARTQHEEARALFARDITRHSTSRQPRATEKQRRLIPFRQSQRNGL
jgi:hypothetical protein